MKIPVYLLSMLFIHLCAQKQCIVCEYKDEKGNVKMTEAYCNIGTHPKRKRCLCHEQADTVCKKICTDLQKEFVKTHIWESN